MVSKKLEKKIESNRHFIEVLLIVVTLLASLHGPTDKTYGDIAGVLVILFVVLSIMYYDAIGRPKFLKSDWQASILISLLSYILAGIIGMSVGLSAAVNIVAVFGGLTGLVIILLITLIYFYVFSRFFENILDIREKAEPKPATVGVITKIYNYVRHCLGRGFPSIKEMFYLLLMLEVILILWVCLQILKSGQ